MRVIINQLVQCNHHHRINLFKHSNIQELQYHNNIQELLDNHSSIPVPWDNRNNIQDRSDNLNNIQVCHLQVLRTGYHRSNNIKIQLMERHLQDTHQGRQHNRAHRCRRQRCSSS